MPYSDYIDLATVNTVTIVMLAVVILIESVCLAIVCKRKYHFGEGLSDSYPVYFQCN